ncbi:MAG TPA: tRNA uridine(34) 5-carboxymethylaminomethyl modification radical SAM/GNAT enzyme Elp3, partial [Candidatus Nanoarchaeia archaeon]|nr:tRNA uridine(34) 5-carboxymethylaminomethyl modification radical SAM/GNAT enzyme Elp3 [Candidatus Nanoarchaeia archaeon]
MGKAEYIAEFLGRATQGKFPRAKLMELKRRLAKQYHISPLPNNVEMLMHAKAEQLPKLRQLLVKPVRSLSGVAVIAVMTKPISCKHGKCLYCPGGPGSVFGDVPMSYTGKEPSTMR